MNHREPSGRTLTEIRPITLEAQVNRFAEGSVLIRAGNTHILCTASVEESVPGWLKGKGKGWISAEYSMLPRATHTRNKRDREKVSGRTQEIQRLIGRALRSIVNMDQLGERSILIDCDVLQADGGTRTASITGGCIALGFALGKLIAEGKIPVSAWLNTVAAISVGIKNKEVFVDLDYNEDSTCDVDMNFVMTGIHEIVEVQGTAERQTFSKKDLDAMFQAAENAIQLIRNIQLDTFRKFDIKHSF